MGVEANATATTKPAGSLLSRIWPVFVGAVLLALVGAFVWLAPVSRAIKASAERRNFADLEIAAAGLERWSATVSTMATSNFVKDIVRPLPRHERDYGEGWRSRALLRHPQIGEFKLVYLPTTRSGCEDIRKRITDAEGTLPFVANFYGGRDVFLKVVGSVPLAPLFMQDTRLQNGAFDKALADKWLTHLVGEPVTLPETTHGPGDYVLCYAAGVPLGRVLNTDALNGGFQSLLVFDPDRRVVAQAGNDTLPLKTIAGLEPDASDDDELQQIANVLTTLNGTPRTTLAKTSRVSEKAIADRLEAIDVNVGGEDYVAFIRPFTPPESFSACLKTQRPVAAAVAPGSPAPNGASSTTTPASADKPSAASAAIPPTDCLIVGLMPRPALWRDALSLPVVFGMGLAMLLIATVALLPTLRLVLLGPGEGLGRAEVIGVVLGIPAAASMATLALLYTVSVEQGRGQAAATAQRLAIDAASRTAGQLVEARVELAKWRNNPGWFAAADPFLPTDSTAAEVRQAQVNQCRESKSTTPCVCTERLSGLPLIELAVRVDEDGLSLPGTATTACRSFLGGRINVSTRDYFHRIRDGSAGEIDGTFTEGQKPPAPYVVEHVKGLQEGVPKLVIAEPLDGVSSDRSRTYLIATTTLTEMMAPIVPHPFTLALVDTRDDLLPVLLHSNPRRAGAEHMAHMLTDTDGIRDGLRRLVRTGEKSEAVPFRFSGYYDGADRRFIAAPVAGTRWVAIASYDLAGADALANQTAIQTLRVWASFSLICVLAWLAWLGWQARRRPPLWTGLWPSPSRTKEYIDLKFRLAGLALATLLVEVVVAIGLDRPFMAVAFGVACRVAAAVHLHMTLCHSQSISTEKVGVSDADAQSVVNQNHNSGGLDPVAQSGVEPDQNGDVPVTVAQADLKPDQYGGVLGPGAQHAFAMMFAALVLCLSVVPMIGFWTDGRDHALAAQSTAVDDALASTGTGAALPQQVLRQTRWAFGLEPDKPGGVQPGLYDVVEQTTAASAEVRHRHVRLSDYLDILGGGNPPTDIPACKSVPCFVAAPVHDALPAIDVAWTFVVVLLLGSGLCLALVLLAQRAMQALCGFGIALEAYTAPVIELGALLDKPEKPSDPPLSRRLLLVNGSGLMDLLHARDIDDETKAQEEAEKRAEDEAAKAAAMAASNVPAADAAAELAADSAAEPQPAQARVFAIEPSYSEYNFADSEKFDTATRQFAKPEWRDGLLIITGMELILASTDRRLAALKVLEALSDRVERQGRRERLRIVILSDSSPLERILDAYERGQHATRADEERENLRWSRLFEDFVTYAFKPRALVDRVVVDVGTKHEHEDRARAAIHDDVRWLPPQVVATGIGNAWPPDNWPQSRKLPLDPVDWSLDGKIGWPERLEQWRHDRGLNSREAALAHLRNQFIEHYQKLWSSSTHAEHLVMHHLAHGRFVNISAALAFPALVRRGIVVLDPEPRLMSDSFAMFVAQAEKLDDIQEWQRKMPPGAWQAARLPIFLALGLVVVTLVAALLIAGESLNTLLPLLAAGLPTLAAGAHRMFARN